MAKNPDHMSGINALPRTSSWQQSRLDAEAARGLYGGNRWDGTQWVGPNGQPVARAPKPPNPFGKNGTLSQQIDKSLKLNAPKVKPSRDQVREAAKSHKTLVVTTASTCFDSVSFKDGLATFVFARDGYVWEQSMDVDDFIDDFASGDLLGVTWNDLYHGVPSE